MMHGATHLDQYRHWGAHDDRRVPVEAVGIRAAASTSATSAAGTAGLATAACLWITGARATTCGVPSTTGRTNGIVDRLDRRVARRQRRRQLIRVVGRRGSESGLDRL